MTKPPQPFNRISRRYQFVNRIISFGLDALWRRSAINAAQISGGLTILDLGCGPGEMLELIPQGCRKIGVDPEISMLKEGESNFYRIKCIGEKLPVMSGSIDRVLSAFVLRNLSDRRLVFGECHRVLTDRGRGALIDFSTPCGGSLWNPVNIHLKFILPIIGGMLAADYAAYRYLSRTIFAFPQPVQIEEELAEAGFINISSRRLIGGVAVLYSFQKSHA